jgi:hypothetical protein
MTEQFPDSSGAAALEGEAAHWVGSETLSGRGGDPFVGRTAPNGVIISEEMVDAARVYVAAVHKHLNGVSAVSSCAVEVSVTIPRIHPDCHGTPDCALTDGLELHIFDLKYGFGIVDPYDNWQMICYAAGLVRPEHQFVNIHIVQPRPFHFDGPHRTWRVGVAALDRYIKQLQESAAETLTATPRCVSGSHCKYCSARHACGAARKAAMFAIDYTSHMRAEVMDTAALSMELRTVQRAAEAIQFLLTGLESQAKGIIDKGGDLPGWTLQAGAGKQQWKVPVAEVIALSQIMGVELCKNVDTITPTQARKAGLPEDIVSMYSERTSGEKKLVPFNGVKIASIFGQQ